jgi:hypothetical protein
VQHHVVEVGVAVHDARLAVLRPVGLQPVRQLGHRRQRPRVVPVVAVALQQPEKLRNLTRQKGSRPSDRLERATLEVHVAQLGEARGVRQPDVVAHSGVVDVGRRHLVARVEPVHLLHEVEHDAEHGEILATGDESRVRHRRSGKCAQHGDLAQHRLVARRAGVQRWPAQHHRPVVDPQPHHDVLRPARQRRHIGDAGPEPGRPDPVLHRGEILVGECRKLVIGHG